MTVQTIAHTINPSGGDYASLKTWIAACPTNLTTVEKSACGTFAIATFIVGEVLNFVGSGAVGKLLKTDSTGIGTGTYLTYSITSGNPATNDVVTGATSTATCILTSGTPTDVGAIWQGRVGNCELLTTSNTEVDCNITGITSSATCYVELTADTGCSYLDNPNVRTTALAYNDSNYARCKHTGNNYSLISIPNVDYTRVNRLQFKNNTIPESLLYVGTYNTCWVDKCIFDGSCADNGTLAIFSTSSNPIVPHKVTNCLVINRYNTANNIAFLSDGTTADNCTFIGAGSTITNGLKCNTNFTKGGPITNCYVGGHITTVTTGSPTVSHSFTSVSGPPSGWSAAAFSTATFTGVTSGSEDLRIAVGSALIGAGVTDATSGTYDISGYAWASPPDVGAWQSTTATGLNITTIYGTAAGTGYSAQVDKQSGIQALYGTATGTGYTATIAQTQNITATYGTAAATGYTAGLASSISASYDTAAATGYTARLDTQQDLSALYGVATATGYDASIATSGTLSITATYGTVTATGYTAGIDYQTNIQAIYGSASGVGYLASLNQQDSFVTSYGVATAVGYRARLSGRGLPNGGNTGGAQSQRTIIITGIGIY